MYKNGKRDKKDTGGTLPDLFEAKTLKTGIPPADKKQEGISLIF
jgi:hypothetical protein